MKYTQLDLIASFMLAEIRLSNYDNQFINNLILYIARNNVITSNQDKLFKRVSKKYEKQFKQHKIEVDEVLALPWSCKVIPSLPEYTDTSILINNDLIIVRAPYKKDFISALRKNPIYGLQWERDRRQYEMKFSLVTLKKVLSLCVDHYQDINFSPEISQIVETLSIFDNAKYWDPTLVLKNDKLYILACTEYLYEAIKDIPLDLSLKTVAKLASYGINVDESVKEYFCQFNSVEKVNFASSFITTFEGSLLPIMFGWLKEFECNTVGEFNLFTANKLEWKEAYINSLEKLKMKHVSSSEIKNLQGEDITIITSRGAATILADKPLNLFKFVKCVNSTPVKLGPR